MDAWAWMSEESRLVRWMRRALKAGLVGGLAVAGLCGVVLAIEEPIPLLQGPQDIASLTTTLNNLIRRINALAPTIGTMFSDASNAILPDARTNLHALPAINVKDYGATGNGATDDSAAFQAAISAATAAGYATSSFGESYPPVTIPAGNYRVCNLQVPARGVIQGVGNTLSTVLTLTDGCNANMFTVAPPAPAANNYLSYGVFENMLLDGNKDNQTAGTSHAIEIADDLSGVNGIAGIKTLNLDVYFFRNDGVHGGVNRNATYLIHTRFSQNGGRSVYQQGYDWFADNSLLGTAGSYGWEIAARGTTTLTATSCYNAAESCFYIGAGSNFVGISGGVFNGNFKAAIEQAAYSRLVVVGVSFASNGQAADNTYPDILVSSGGAVTVIGANVFPNANPAIRPKYFIEQTDPKNAVVVVAPQFGGSYGTATYSNPEKIISSLSSPMEGFAYPLIAGVTGDRIAATIVTKWTDQLSKWSADNVGVRNVCMKSRATTIGDHATVATGDEICNNTIYADDGTTYKSVGQARWQALGTIGTNQVPTAYEVDVTNGSGTLINGLQVNGNLGVLKSYLPVQVSAGYATASLPACNGNTTRTFAAVTDSLNPPVYGDAPTGGGTIVAPVFCNGSAWSYH